MTYTNCTDNTIDAVHQREPVTSGAGSTYVMTRRSIVDLGGKSEMYGTASCWEDRARDARG
jgi:hypothetical protein